MTYFFDKSITLKRRHQTIGDRFAYSSTGTAYMGNVQGASATREQSLGGRVVETYVCFVDSSVPAHEGDTVIIDSVSYKVKGVAIHEFGSFHYKKLTITGNP